MANVIKMIKHPNTLTGIASALVLCGELMGAGSARAQDAPAADAASTQQETNTGSELQLQEVVVTAERRGEDVQTTPLIITAVQGNQLSEQHLVTVQDLTSVVPSLDANTSGNAQLITIRGIGDTAVNGGIVPGVAIIRDGMLYGETMGLSSDNYDIQDVEVLKGPQGTYVGASSTGGAVEINSASPNFQGLHGYAQAQVGAYNEFMTQAAVNLPVSDTFAARIALNDETRNSFYKDIGALLSPGTTDQADDPGNHNSRDARLGIFWKPTDSFQLLSKVEYDQEYDDGILAQESQTTYQSLFNNGGSNAESLCTVTGQQLSCPQPGLTTNAQYYSTSTHQPYVINRPPVPEENHYLYKSYMVNPQFTFANGTVLRVNSGLQSFNQVDVTLNTNTSVYKGFNIGALGPDDQYWTSEADLLSPTTGPFYSKVNWIAGFFNYYRYTPSNHESFNYAAEPSYLSPLPAPTSIQYASNYHYQHSQGLFGQVSWQLMTTLQLQVGARENWDHQVQTGLYDTTEAYPSGAVLSPGILEKPSHDAVPTWKVGLNWTPMAGQYFYLFDARGYKAGGANNTVDNPFYHHETVTDYELGWKSTLLGGHLLTDVGAYYMNYDDLQYGTFNVDDLGTQVVNLAPTTIKGLELSAQTHVAGLGVSVGANYNKSALGAVTVLNNNGLPPGFNSPVIHPQCGVPLAAGETCFNYLPYEQSLSGEEMPFAPQFTGNVAIDYAIPVGAGVLDPRMQFSHTDKQYATIFQTTYNEMGPRNILNANIDYLRNEWEVQAYVTNLTNRVYLEGNNGESVYYGAPRQYGMYVKRTF